MTSTAAGGDRRPAARRPPVTPERVFRAAIELADESGIEALTMRRLASRLDIEVMSLYYHVPNKEAVLDGAIDLVFAEIEAKLGLFDPTVALGDAWRSALRTRILGARVVLLRHPWAPGVMESRSDLGPARARYLDAVVGTLRAGGFSYDLVHHAMHALGSRAFGFSQELISDDDDGPADEEVLALLTAEAPHLVEMLAHVRHDDPDSTLGWCDDQFEFEFGLDLVLDGLDHRRRAAR